MHREQVHHCVQTSRKSTAISECLGTAVNGLPNINPETRETRLGIETRETSLDTILEFFTIETFETRETCLIIDVNYPLTTVPRHSDIAMYFRHY